MDAATALDDRRPRLPDFVVIGAQRSGTSSLAHYLSGHPEIYIAASKEVHFFDWEFHRGISWYERHFASAREPVAGEATPSYMYTPGAMERMAHHLPDARLVAILRNPIDRAYSHYWFNRSQKKERLSFADAIRREAERLSSGDPRSRHAFSYVDRGRYIRQLRRVAELYPRSSVHVVVFEDMKADAAGAFRDLCTFLGVDADVEVPRVGGTTNRYVEYHSLLLKDLTPKLPRPVRKLAGRVNRKRTSPYEPMDEATRNALRETFRDDNEALRRWLDRDDPLWEE